MKCDIYYSKFDSDLINKYGWSGEEGKLSLKITHPLHSEYEQSIDAVDEALSKNKFKYMGRIEVEKESPGEAMWKLQNDLYAKGHPLKGRSMMLGDVVVCGDRGWIAEDDEVGWSGLSCPQVREFEKLKM